MENFNRVISFCFDGRIYFSNLITTAFFLALIVGWYLLGKFMKDKMKKKRRPIEYIRLVLVSHWILELCFLALLIRYFTLYPLELDRDKVDFPIMWAAIIGSVLYIVSLIWLLTIGSKAEKDFYLRISQFANDNGGKLITGKEFPLNYYKPRSLSNKMGLSFKILMWDVNNLTRFFFVSQVWQTNLGLPPYTGVSVSFFGNWIWKVNNKLPEFVIRKNKTNITDIDPSFERQWPQQKNIEDALGGKWSVDIETGQGLQVLLKIIPVLEKYEIAAAEVRDSMLVLIYPFYISSMKSSVFDVAKDFFTAPILELLDYDEVSNK